MSKTRPYRPSNGTEGCDFEARFCDRCARDAAFRESDGAEDGCPLIANAFAFEIGHPDYPKEWIEDEHGPRCTAFTTNPISPPRCLHTLEMFPEEP